MRHLWLSVLLVLLPVAAWSQPNTNTVPPACTTAEITAGTCAPARMGTRVYDTTLGYLVEYNDSDWVAAFGMGGIGALANDTTPQLGGDLDLNGNAIDFPTTANINDTLDEDDLGSDSAVALATQQSIKAYVDTTTVSLGGDTMTGQLTTDNTGIEFTESDTNPTCSTGNYAIYADLSETALKKCVNGVASDLGSVGGSGNLGSNLSSTSNDILTNDSSGYMILGGTGNTNNENLRLDFESVANHVGVETTSSVDTVDFTGMTVGASTFLAAPSASPTISFNDSDFDDTGDEARIVSNANAADNGEISLQLEAGSDNTYVTALQVESNSGVVSSLISGKQDRNNISVDDDDCTGEQGLWWFDTTDGAFEFCNANSGAPAVLSGGGLGSNLSSSTNDITTSNSTINLNDSVTSEAITATFSSNTITFTSNTGVSTFDFPNNAIAGVDVSTLQLTRPWPISDTTVDGVVCTKGSGQPVKNAFDANYIVCSGASGIIYGTGVISDSWGTGQNIIPHVIALDNTGSVTLSADFSYQCWTNDEAVTSTWSSTSQLTMSLTTANDSYRGNIGAFSASGCSANDLFAWRYVTDASHTGTSSYITSIYFVYQDKVGS